ncbi:MAG TPA: sugar MFS transporter [Panacibacter sp.]|nr:sugar MFS transporter [Panacibacter sp.]HNP44852.1 sugar MFS transporter [Panacibacter sp.]
MSISNPAAPVKNNYKAIFVIGVLFFVFGFVTWINSILIPYFKLTCNLSTKQSMLVAFAFYISYFVMALPAAAILKRTGLKNGMMLGLFVMAVGALVFIPAAINRTYEIFLAGLFIQATGLTILQTASNPYITILGPIESAASRISIMGICNKAAGAIAPLILINAITKNPEEIDLVQKQLPTLSADGQALLLNELSSRLIVPYIIMAIVLIGLGLMIRLAHLPDISQEEKPDADNGIKIVKNNILQFPHLILGAITIYCAVSVEVIAVDSIIGYAQYKGYNFSDAKFFASYTLIFMILSYAVGVFAIPKIIRQRKALQLCGAAGFLLTLLAIFISGNTSVWCIAMLGLFNAMLWPNIWPLALDGLGKFTSRGSALLIMGIIGGALTPLIYGYFSDKSNHQLAYWVLLPCYLFILYYSTFGYKAGKQSLSEE